MDCAVLTDTLRYAWTILPAGPCHDRNAGCQVRDGDVINHAPDLVELPRSYYSSNQVVIEAETWAEGLNLAREGAVALALRAASSFTRLVLF
jgi:hypothetical protein